MADEWTDHGGPAFPRPKWNPTDGDSDGHREQGGMTLRQWYAGQAIKGYVAMFPNQDPPCSGGLMTAATRAFLLADCMIRVGELGPVKLDFGLLVAAAEKFERAAVAAITHLRECESGKIAHPFKSSSLPLLEEALAELRKVGRSG